MNFELIKNLKTESFSELTESIFLTLDQDWCPDFVMKDSFELLNSCGAVATCFLTHQSESLISPFSNHEFAIHPNFNPLLLQASAEKGLGADEVVKKMLNFLPTAQSVRSHSLVNSSSLSNIFRQHSLRYECNLLIPHYLHLELRPWVDFTGMIKVPHFWEDDVHVLTEDAPGEMKKLLKSPGLKVFLFHPIHLFLNTKSLAHYEKAKAHLKDENELVKLVNKSEKGVRDFFLELVGLV